MNVLSTTVFLVLVAATIAVTWWAARRNRSADSHYVAGSSITGRQNGLAIAGDYISAASFLGVTGAMAIAGFNGFYLAVFVPVAFVLALLLIAEPLRNLGRFTLADVLATRFSGSGVRSLMAVSTVVISILYMVAQFVGAAVLVRLLFGLDYWQAFLLIGFLTTVYTLLGGMLATTWIQILKTGLLLACAVVLFALVVSRYGFNPLNVFDRVYNEIGPATASPTRTTTLAGLDQFSMVLGLVLGVLGLPHAMIRFLTVRDARAARSSALTSIWVFSAFYLLIPVIAYGAGHLVGTKELIKAHPSGQLAIVQLAEHIGGGFLLAVIAAVTIATILAVLSGLVIAATGAIAHDLWGQVLRRGRTDERGQMRAARVATLLTCLVASVIAFVARDENVAFLASLAITVAASANLPVLLLTIYWRRMTAAGVFAGITVGLITSVGMIMLGPVMLGSSAVVPLANPAVVSVPAGFLAAVIGALLHQPGREARVAADRVFESMQLRAFGGGDSGTGAHRAAPQPAAVQEA